MRPRFVAIHPAGLAVFVLCAVLAQAQGVITTIAGAGGSGFAGDGGQAREAVFSSPRGIVVDSAGDVFVADTGNNRVRKIAPNGMITTIAGAGGAGFSGDGGPATQALLNSPTGLALDRTGNLYITDSVNFRIRKVDANGIISTVAGGVPAVNISLFTAGDVAVDSQGNLYIPDNFDKNWVIYRVSPNGTISPFAGGSGVNVGFIAINTAGAVYAAFTPEQFGGGPSGGGVIHITADGVNLGVIPVPPGDPGKGAFDALGNLYLPELSAPGLSQGTSNCVVEISPSGVTTTLAGISPQAGFSGDDGPATQALLNAPYAVALDAAGNLYIADSGNNRIRKVFLNPASGLFQPSLQKTLQPGYYIAAVTLGQGEHAGYWGMQVLASAGVLLGGLNFGGSIQQADKPVGYGGFYVPIPESIHFHVEAQAADGSSSSTVALGVQLLDASKNPVSGVQFGGTSVDFTQPLSQGYYTMTVNDGANSPLENFQVGVGTTEFAGDVNFGAFAAPGSVGFGSFYLAAPQQVTIQVYGQPSLGVDAAGGLRLTLYDANLNVIANVP
jgi:sugar lactone lactonase YvrE